MRRTLIVFTLLALLAVAAVPAFAQDSSIVEIVVASATGDEPQFTVLLAAAQAADPAIVAALSGEGEFTVFAPTDEAFAALLAELEVSAEDLLADQDLLTAVLQYHVLEGAVMSGDIVALLEESDAIYPTTLLGSRIKVALDGENVMVNDATVVAADIEASNGVVHVIDTVLLPPATIAELVVEAASAEEDAEFTLLLAAIQGADPAILETLSGEGAFTVFAPTDAAFEAAIAALGVDPADLLANSELLTGVLLYHVVGSELYSGDIVAALTEAGEEGIWVDSLVEGDPLYVTLTEDGVFVDDAQVIITDIVASNGVIHVIDAVMLPDGE